MAKYLLLLLSDESAQHGQPPVELFGAIDALSKKWTAAGVLLESGGLGPTAHSVQVRNEDGEIRETAGPFHAGGEAVTGYAMVEVDSQEEAVARAREFVALHQEHWPAWRGASEVRAVFGPES